MIMKGDRVLRERGKSYKVGRKKLKSRKQKSRSVVAKGWECKRWIDDTIVKSHKTIFIKSMNFPEGELYLIKLGQKILKINMIFLER